MALNKDILGLALYNRLTDYNNKTIDELGEIEDVRLAFCKALADEVINHFKNNAVLSVPGAGLTAGAVAVAGTSTTGHIL